MTLLLAALPLGCLFAALFYSGIVIRQAWAQSSEPTITAPTVPVGYVPQADLQRALQQRDTARIWRGFFQQRAHHHRRLHRRWHRRALRWHRLLHPYSDSWLADALCIHSKEGAWHDPNPPYWGGMQMDRSFMAAYGPEFYRALGTADHWHPKQQLLTAFRGWSNRGGWQPWPNTAKACGLL